MLAGSIYMFAGSTAPQGFLLCDGSAVSRTTYATLFDTIGTTYGAGDGSTTFNLPDMSGRVPVGVSQSYALASTGGEEGHVLLSSEIPTHSHEIAQHGHASTIKFTTPQLTHTITQAAFKYSAPNGQTAAGSQLSNPAFSGTSSVAASRTTNCAVSNHAAAACTMSGSITDCNAFNTDNSGTDQAHDNMQPYITLNYVIATGD
jgi:microcystin-dependent protein